MKISVGFDSVWANGIVSTESILDLDTGEVTDIVALDAGDEYRRLVSENIEYDGLTAAVSLDGNNRYFLKNKGDLQQFKDRHMQRMAIRCNIETVNESNLRRFYD